MNILELLNGTALSHRIFCGDTVYNDLASLDACHLCSIDDFVYDSRRAKENTAFFCLVGAHSDGHNYAHAAYLAGCRIFLAMRSLSLPDDALVVVVEDTRAALATLSDIFFGHPQRELTVIGITGTKGKTTVTHLTAAALTAAGIPCGTVGTIGITYNGKTYPTVNSTPESDVIHRTLRKMADDGIKAVVMEVSSLALVRNRVDGIRFDIAAFTNLSEDHISDIEHPDFSDYKNAKKRLFSMCELAVINTDDAYSEEFIAACTSPYTTYGISESADLSARKITPWQNGVAMGITFSLFEKENKHSENVTLRLPGTFNAQNALCVIGILRHMGLDYSDILPTLARASVPGRFELLDVLENVTVVLDYAHNEMSMRSLLETVRAYKPKRIVTLFGSIGGRAQHRRRELALVTGDLADFAVITTDNPDFENPEEIVREIASYYTKDMCPYQIIVDREEAIRYVLTEARAGDVLLFCGKGHETYQIINGVHVPFSEKDIISKAAASIRAAKKQAVQTTV